MESVPTENGQVCQFTFCLIVIAEYLSITFLGIIYSILFPCELPLAVLLNSILTATDSSIQYIRNQVLHQEGNKDKLRIATDWLILKMFSPMAGFGQFFEDHRWHFFTNCSHYPVRLRSKNIPLLLAFGINDTFSRYIILDPKISGGLVIHN